ncbi:XRE family transcriptional regulator [Stenotrophomonas pavanii]|uniref:LexA family transcriptional regulator n=1 Tax=Stenotrophomonas pavanii TaxID=487698 RepID=UPI002895219C|nr:XRE family transcriptional regulator [Stenotrophomonas pavanii]MDT3530255.1 XRE family transcriptional regulator [Stenotrophomonas pavanii]
MKNTRSAKPTPEDVAAARRLKELWKHRASGLGLTQTKMAEELGITQGAVSQYLNGRIPLNYRTLMAFCQALGIADTDVRTDLPEQQFSTPAAPSDDYLDVVALPHPGLAEGTDPDQYAQAHSMKFRKSVLRQRGLLTRPLAVFIATGNSMEPAISNGDSVLLDTSGGTVADGHLYVVCWSEDGKPQTGVKRAMTIEGNVFFTSDNPNGGDRWQKPRRLDAKREHVDVLGQVHWIGSWAN